MTTVRFAIGVAAGIAALGSVTLGARALRRRFLHTLHGPPAWLADLVVVIAAIVVVSQLLGSVGLFRLGVLAPALIACGAAAWYVGSRGRRSGIADATSVSSVPHESSDNDPTRAGPVVTVVAIAAVGVLIAAWVPRLVDSYRSGPLTIDTMWYHLPIAARFAQTGNVLDLVFVTGGNSLPTFYPHTSELLHAVGIVFLGHDTLTPLLNFFWLLVAMFAAWCIGRPFGAAPLTLTATAVILGGPQLVMYEAGQAINDLLGAAMTLAAFAILVNTWKGTVFPAGVFYAGLAMGLALSSKFTVVGPAAALTVCVFAFSPRGQRIRLGALWTGALVLTGGFWFLRNLVSVGNPVPPMDISLGPIELPSMHIVGVSTLSSHLIQRESWSRDLLPAFRYAMGPVWWAVLAIVFGGFVLGIVIRIDQRVRLMAVVGLTSVVIFIFSPQALGFFGDANFFRYNVRYLVIPFVLGATTLALVCARYGSRVTNAMSIAFAIILLLSQLDEKFWPFSAAPPPELGLPELSRRELVLGIAAGLCVTLLLGAAVVVWLRPRARWTKRATLLRGAAIGVVIVGGLLSLQTFYLDRRYTNAPFLTKSYVWARDAEDERVGLVGTFLQYPLTGNDISNRVQYLDQRTSDHDPSTSIVDCTSWRRTLNRERLDYVIVTTPGFPIESTAPAPQRAWTEDDPAARLVLTDKEGEARAWLYELNGRLDPSTCPPVPETGTAG